MSTRPETTFSVRTWVLPLVFDRYLEFQTNTRLSVAPARLTILAGPPSMDSETLPLFAALSETRLRSRPEKV